MAMDYTKMAIQLLENMHTLHRAKPQRHINEAFQGEAFVLKYLARHGGDVLPGTISSEMHVSSARIAAALNNLERKGLLTRRADTADRRKILVNLTPEGKRLAQRHYDTVVQSAARLLCLLGDEDAVDYLRITNKLVGIIDANEGLF